MAGDNKTLGRFELTDIPPAPRGMPQIEVTFDIDANGIVNVSAKDKGTGKEQSIKITASSGLSEEEIEQLVKDAELHAEEDKKKRELVEAKNQADAVVYQTEKSLKEVGDKIDAETKANIESHIEKLKTKIEGTDAEAIKTATQELTEASHKLAEKIYQQQSEQGQQEGQPEGDAGQDGQAQGSDDDVVDADFEEVKDDKK
jgi:molecular chaperone DnaK